jgi:anti-sigma B factor antagonist
MTTDNTEQLRISVGGESDAAVIYLEGELDPHTAPKLQREIDRLVLGGADRVVLDMSRLVFIDSSGLRVVISSHRDLHDRGGSLALRSPSRTAQRLLQITGLTDHIDVVEQ